MGVRAPERDGWGRHPLRAMVEGGRTIAEEKYNHQKILRPLRYKTHQPEENGIVEQTLLTRGGPSQAALSLEHQLTSNDIILVMSLRPSGVTGAANRSHCHNGNTNVNVTANTTATAGIITNGPWDRG